MTDEAIAAEIVRQLARRAPTSSICPSEVARALAAAEDMWRALMPRVRDAAAGLRERACVRITRAGADVAREDLHAGPVRIARGPRFDEAGGP